MPKEYRILPAEDNSKIAEQEYGVGTTLQFTKFTSCVGVLSRVKNSDNIVGVHIVQLGFDTDGDYGVQFTQETLNTEVKKILDDNDCDPSTTLVIGEYGWGDNTWDGCTKGVNDSGIFQAQWDSSEGKISVAQVKEN